MDKTNTFMDKTNIWDRGNYTLLLLLNYRSKVSLILLICFLVLCKHIAYADPAEEAPVASNVVANTITQTGRQPIHAPIAYDANGPIKSYTLVTVPASGSLYIGSSGGSALSAGTTLTAAQAANLYYTPPTQRALLLFTVLIEGTYAFTYTATDSDGVVSNTATYSIPVGATNTPASPTPATIIALYMPNSIDQAAIPGLVATGGTIDGYRITSLPRASEGVLYTSSTATGPRTAITELTNGYYELTMDQANNLWFDPEPTFDGKATFTYTATNTQSTTYSGNATYTVPVYKDAEITPLPVELTGFKAAVSGRNTISLFWETATERNSDYFSVERSTDGRHFERTGAVKAKGHSSTLQGYTFTDTAPAQGTNYYRLRQVDLDGSFTFSAVVAARAAGSAVEGKLLAYPNSTAADLTLAIEGMQDEAVSIEVLDLLGKPHLQKAIKLKAANNTVPLDLTNLSSGVYLVMVRGRELRLTQRIVKR
jgi:hypothetical protein